MCLWHTVRMGSTLLLGAPGTSWREWLRENLHGRDLLIADPSDATLGPAARIELWRDERLLAWRFYGALSPTRAPHILIDSVRSLADLASADYVVALPAYLPGALLRQVSIRIAEALRPERILIDSAAEIDLGCWPIGPEVLEADGGNAPVVSAAMRKAHWLRLIDSCEIHDVDLAHVAMDGARLGSGIRLDRFEREQFGIGRALHSEVNGSTLFVVTAEPLDDSELAKALDATHTGRAHVVAPDDYRDLICAFARDDGEDFGMGFVREIDFELGRARVVCDAVSPAPVRLFRWGGLKVDASGRELMELRPWEV